MKATFTNLFGKFRKPPNLVRFAEIEYNIFEIYLLMQNYYFKMVYQQPKVIAS